MSTANRCTYCGTMLTSDVDGNEVMEDATGETHFVARCREYVFGALQHAKAENGRLRAFVGMVVDRFEGTPQDLIARAGRDALQSDERGRKP